MVLLLIAALAAPAGAQSAAAPTRQVPPTVLAEVSQLESRFELALAEDCPAALCDPVGCAYLDHAVADRPRARSLPGLTDGTGPGSVEAQAFLTQATCTFTHEATLDPGVAQVLSRRLQARLSSGWAVVTVTRKGLPPLPDPLVAPPATEAVSPPPEAAPPPPLTSAAAGQQLWDALLPHAFWMVGLGLFTIALGLWLWSWRRVGRLSPEEELLLGQLVGTPADEAAASPASVEPEPDPAAADAAWVAAQRADWMARLSAFDPDAPDAGLQALLRHLLRAGETALLAKATLSFPDALPRVFPTGGDVATAKLALAEAIESTHPADLPDDATFFAAWNRHALASRLASQPDAAVVRRLRDDFGAAGLAARVAELPPRVGALLITLAPPANRLEVARLLPTPRVEALCAALLRSNRMDPAETRAVFAALDEGATAPPDLPRGVADQGTPVPAAAALSVLLARLPADRRGALLSATLDLHAGTLPAWMHGVVTPDLVTALPAEAQADLLLAVPIEALAAWLDTLRAQDRAAVQAAMPAVLRDRTAGALAPTPVTRAAQAEQARLALSTGLTHQLARLGQSHERAWSHTEAPAG